MENKKNENKKVKEKVEETKTKKAKKEKKPLTEKQKKVRKILKIIILVLVLTILICGGILMGIIFSSDDFQISKEDIKIGASNSKIVDQDGNFIAEISGDEKRQIITMGEMAEYLPKAYVAIEDERFYEHHGVDIMRTGKAIVTFVLHGGKSSFGGSTITQQLIKNITDETENSKFAGAIRKAKEMVKAYKIENMFSKDQILELYLNILFIGGNDLHGVELGSQYYFSKSAKDLDLAECAFLAGINNAPNSYKPFSDDQKMKDLVKNRVKTVLNKMNELGYIKTKEEYDTAIAKADAGLTFTKGAAISNLYSWHTEALINQVVDELIEEKGWSKDMAQTYLYSGGFTIYSTVDSNIQTAMEEEMKKTTYIKNSKKREGKTSQAAMVLMDHTNGRVLATVGGLGEKTVVFGTNRATQSQKATGSSMKPLAVIAPAIENGVITAASVYDDAPIDGIPLKNYYGGFKGLSTVRYAIEISQNIVPVRIIRELGYSKSIEFMRKVGISSLVTAEENKEHNDEGNSLALGGLTHGITPLEMAAGYSAIANDGVYIEPTFYTKIVDSKGNTILESKQDTRTVMTPSNAYIVKSILTQPVVGPSGTATYCKIPGMETCAKTGTTSDDFDRWLCGFTPYYTGAAWYGYDYNETVIFSGNPAAKIWDSVMNTAHQELPNKNFDVPDDIIRVTVCKDSGLLPTEYCSEGIDGRGTYTEVFVKGTEPKKKCTCHVKARVCMGEDGAYRLAGQYCKDAQDVVFITREGSEDYTSWQRAADAEFMLPTETCTTHLTDPNKNNTITNNTVTNNTVTNNTVTNNTVKNNTVTNNTVTNNTVTNNTVTNNTVTNNTVTNNTVTNNTVTNNTVTNNTVTNNIVTNNTVTNNVVNNTP